MPKNVRNDTALFASSLTINNVTINTSGNTAYTLTLPTSAGSSGQVLVTDGSGVLSWSSSLPPSSTGTNLTLSGTLTAATVNVTGLTASRAVATDASKNLVSVANTGSGNNVLATAPTITNLTLTSASESALVLTATNNSTGFTNLITDFTAPNTPSMGRAILRHGRDTGTGNAIQYQFQYEGDNNTSNRMEIGVPALITTSRFEIVNNPATPFRFYNPSGPVSFTGNLNVGGLTASSSVATDGSKNLVSVTNTGSGNNVLATSPTLVTPVLGVASATSLATNSLLPSGNLVVDLTSSGFFTIGAGSNTNLCLNITSGTDFTRIATSSGATFSSDAALGDTVIRNDSKQLHFQRGSGSSCFSINSSNIFVLRAQPVFNVALSVGNGGTGLSSIGAADTVLSSNGSVASWRTSTGTGNNVLATSPTLTTPNIGAATGTSLVNSGGVTGSSLTASNGTTLTTNVANDLTLALSSSNSTTIADIETYKTSNSSLKQTLALNRFGGAVTVGTGGLTIGTPLVTGSGGTGLSTVGSNGQVLTVVAGAPAWSAVTAPSIIGSTISIFGGGTSQTITSGSYQTVTFGSAPATGDASTGTLTGITFSGGTFTNNSTPKLVLVNFQTRTGGGGGTVVSTRILNSGVIASQIDFSPSDIVQNTIVLKLAASGTISVTYFQDSGSNRDLPAGTPEGNVCRISITVLTTTLS